MGGSSQGIDALGVLLVLAAVFSALGVSAALGSMAFGVRDLAAPKGLPRRAEVLMLLVSLVVPVLVAFAFFSWFGSHEGASAMFAPSYVAAAVPTGSLAFALYVRLHGSKGRRSRTALVLAVLSCLLSVAPVLSYGYAFLRA